MSAVTTLSRADLTVEPGGQAVVTVRIRSNASIVDRFDVDVVGPTSGWAQLAPASLSLFPGAEGLVEVTFLPPRASTPRAGVYPFAIRVRPAADPTRLSVEEGKLTVTPFTAVSAEIAPQTSRGARAAQHVVTVENGGNAPSEVVVTAVDPDRHLRLSVDPPRAVVRPADRMEFRVRAEAGPFTFGAVRAWSFSVRVAPGRQSPIQLRATMNQRPLLMGRFPTLGALAAAGVALLAVAFLTGIGPFAAPPTPGLIAQESAAPSADVESQAPSSAPSSAPPSEAPSSSEPSAPPSPTPTVVLGEFELAIPDPGVTSGALLADPTCDLSPGAPCYRTAVTVLTTMAQSLGAAYAGDGVVGRDVAVGNGLTLPIAVDRDGPFTWATDNGGASGDTHYVVVDLAPLIATEPGFAYAVVQRTSGDAPSARFLVDDALAHALLEEIYDVNNQMVDPGPVRSLPPILQTFDPGQLEWNFDFTP